MSRWNVTVYFSLRNTEILSTASPMKESIRCETEFRFSGCRVNLYPALFKLFRLNLLLPEIQLQ